MLKKLIKGLLPDHLLCYRAKCESGEYVLSFDDGPHPEHSKLILDILSSKQAKAVFFVQGKEAEAYPEIIRTMHEAGHILGNHSYYHKFCREMSSYEYMADVERTHALLESITDSRLPKLFRPPYGDLSIKVTPKLMKRGYRHFMWSVDSEDSYLKSESELMEYIRTLDIATGDVLLFHEDYEQTVASLGEIIDTFAQKGFKPGLPCEV